MEIGFLIQSAGDVINAAHRYTESLKNSARSLEKLTTELKSVTPLLSDIRKICKDHSDSLEAGSQYALLESFSPLLEEDGRLENLQAAIEGVKIRLDSISSDKSFRTRILRLTKLEKEEKNCKDLLKDLEIFKSSVSLVLQMLSINDQKRRDGIRQQDQEWKGLLDWLKPYEYNTKHDLSSQSRQSGTCTWLWDNETFSTWHSGSNSEAKFLWLYGIPGSGKTTIASAVIDNLEKEPNITTAYHYCDFRNDESTSPVTVLRSIFIQLLRRSGTNQIESFLDLVSKKDEGKGPPTELSELVKLIHRACENHTRTIIVVDALNECHDDSDRRTLLECLRGLSGTPQYDLSIFVTSPDEPEIRSSFKGLPSISLTDVRMHIEADIKIFVEAELKSSPRLSGLRDSVKEKIIYTLVEKAGGMFQWARCQLNVISDCLTEKDIERALQALPKGLTETYERLLQKVLERGDRAAAMARTVLMWLVGSPEPLCLLKLQEALMIEPQKSEWNEESRLLDPRDIMKICGSLVEVYEPSLEKCGLSDYLPKDDIYHQHCATHVRLSHYTVQEFLQTAPWADTRFSCYRLSPPDVHAELILLSLTYLGFNIFQKEDKTKPLYYYAVFSKLHSKHSFGSLYPYCHECWFFHFRHVEEHNAVCQVLLQFFTKDAKEIISNTDTLSKRTDLEPWCRMACRETKSDRDALFLLAIESGYTWLLKRMLTFYPDMAHWNPSQGGSPLIHAIYKDRPDMVTTLLDFGMNVDMASGLFGQIPQYYSKIRPLHLAIIMGRAQIFNFLMERGADIHARSERPVLEWGANPVPDEPVTTLHVAARYGTPDDVAALLQRGLEPNEVDKEGRNALHYAIYIHDRELKMARKLIQLGVDPTSKDSLGRTPLDYAFEPGLSNRSFIDYIRSEAHLGSAFSTEIGLLHSIELEWTEHESDVPT